MTPRITPGDRADVGLFNWAVAAVSGRVAGTGPLNLFLTLGRNRGLFRGWLFFDSEHTNAAENTNPGNASNWRATAWELHPVTSFSIVPKP